MKAVWLSRLGGLDTLAYGEQPEPIITDPLDMLVRVRATALNRIDLFMREGTHAQAPTQYPFIPGNEFAGDVVAVGSGHLAVEPESEEFIRTRAAYAYYQRTKDPQWYPGQRSGRFKVGDRVFGTARSSFAELVRVRPYGNLPQEAVESIPFGLSYEEAASIPISFLTAWHALHCAGNLRIGEDVLVMSGGSGTGSAAIQLAKAVGGRVITTVGTDAKLEKAKALGADFGINYKKSPQFSKLVLDRTGNEGLDLVFDHIGAPVSRECFDCLKQYGRLVVYGVSGGHMATVHLGLLMMRQLSLIGVIAMPQEDLGIVAHLAARGVIRGIVDSVFPLDATAEAHRRMETDDFFGKIIISIS